MWRLSHRYDWGNMLIRIANKQLKLLATQINETAHLAIREGKYALFIDHAAASNVIAVAGQVGELVPLYSPRMARLCWRMRMNGSCGPSSDPVNCADIPRTR